MKSPSFQSRYRAVLALTALIAGTFLVGGNPYTNAPLLQSGGGVPSLPPAGGQTSGNPQAVTPRGGLNVHKNTSTTGLGMSGATAPPAPGSYFLFSQVETAGSEAAISLPQAMWLVDVAPEADDGPGGLSIGYAANNNAIFFCAASATDSTGLIGIGSSVTHLPTNWNGGTTIAAGVFVAKGDLFQSTLTFSTMPGSGNPDISAYRAMWNSSTVSAATSVAITITFDTGPASPVAFINALHGLATATSTPMNEIDYSNGGQYKHIVPGQGNVAGYPQLVPAQPLPAALTFLFNRVYATGLGGSTNIIGATVVFY